MPRRTVLHYNVQKHLGKRFRCCIRSRHRTRWSTESDMFKAEEYMNKHTEESGNHGLSYRETLSSVLQDFTVELSTSSISVVPSTPDVLWLIVVIYSSCTPPFIFVYFLNHSFLIPHNPHSDFMRQAELVGLSCGAVRIQSEWKARWKQKKLSCSFLVGDKVSCIQWLHCILVFWGLCECRDYRLLYKGSLMIVELMPELLRGSVLWNCIVAAAQWHKHETMSFEFSS